MCEKIRGIILMNVASCVRRGQTRNGFGISHNLFLINRLSKIREKIVRRMLYCGLTYPLLSYRMAWDRVQRHSLDEYLPYKKGL
jgi:hypothetical protein